MGSSWLSMGRFFIAQGICRLAGDFPLSNVPVLVGDMALGGNGNDVRGIRRSAGGSVDGPGPDGKGPVDVEFCQLATWLCGPATRRQQLRSPRRDQEKTHLARLISAVSS